MYEMSAQMANKMMKRASREGDCRRVATSAVDTEAGIISKTPKTEVRKPKD